MIRTSSLINVGRMTEPCGDCKEACQRCLNKNSLDLHHEIEELRAKVSESNNRMIQMEADFADNQRLLELENSRIQDELVKLRDRYDRLMDSHKKLQRLNHNLECKLLSVVEKLEDEKKSLSDCVSNFCQQLLEAKVTICDLREELDRCRQDCNIAVQLLQCKPSNFVPHKLTSLPPDFQQRVKSHLSQKQLMALDESMQLCPQQQQLAKIIRVPMATFPPTAIVYSINQTDDATDAMDSSDAVIPATVMARVLLKPDNGIHQSGRVVICRRCLTEYSVAEAGTQTNCWSTVKSSFNSSHENGLSAVEDSCRNHLLMHCNEPHPKVHRQRYNSTESQF